jgi:hypothetical protein
MWIEICMVLGLLYAHGALAWVFWFHLCESGMALWIADSLLTQYILLRNHSRQLHRLAFVRPGFHIQEALLSVNLPGKEALIVTKDLIKKRYISRSVLIEVLEKHGFYVKDHDFFSINPYLDILYTYDGMPYKMIYEYRNLQDLPIPWISEKVMEDFKKDVILPHFQKRSIDHSMYQLFRECDLVESVELNGVKNEVLQRRLSLYAGPLHDYGSLYLNPMRVKYLLKPVEVGEFRSLVIKFAKGYMCEEEFEMKEHHIVCYGLEDVIQSTRIQEKIKERLKEEHRNASKPVPLHKSQNPS